MSLSGSFNGSFSGISSGNARPYITWSATQSIVGNYSDVTINVYFQSFNGYYAFNNANNHTCNININGDNHGAIANFNLPANGNILVRSRTVRVYHNADGTKTCFLGTDGNPQVGWGTYNFNQVVTLDTIPRAAYITDSSINFTIGNSIPINVYNPGSLYLKALTYVNGVLIKTQTLGQVSSATLTFSGGEISSMYAQVPNATSIGATVRIRTYSDAGYTTQVGSDQDKSCTASVDQTTNKPTFTTYTVANVDKTIVNTDTYGNPLVSSSTATLLGSSAKMIKSYSKLRATILASNKMVALNSATADKYRFVDGSQQAEAAYSSGSTVDIDIDNADTLSTSVSAFDSRGLSTQVVVAMTLMANYTAPSLFSMTVLRDNSVDALTKLAFAGTYYNKYFSSDTTSNPGSGVLNTITMHYRFKNTTNSWTTQNGTTTVTIATPGRFTKTAHGFVTGDVIHLTTTGALPTGLTAGTTYFVIKDDADHFWLATSSANATAGTKIATSGSQSGTHTVNVGNAWTSITPTDTSGALSYNAYINGDLGASGFDTNKSFDIEIRAYDKLSNTIITSVLNIGIPLIDYYRVDGVQGMAINAKYVAAQGGGLQILGKYIMNLIYPIGRVIIDGDNLGNPGTYLGFGTWAAFGTGRVPVGIDAGQTEFDTIGETGGAKTHALTSGENGNHNHIQDAHHHLTYKNFSFNVGGGGVATVTGNVTDGFSGSGNNTQDTTATNQTSGSGTAHNNLQPYIVVNMWKRTA